MIPAFFLYPAIACAMISLNNNLREVPLMKRSEINAALKEMEAMVNAYRFALPPFCHFTPEEWKEKGHDYDEIRDCMLGWDITDYGMGNFDKMGFSLITIRNGNRAMEDKYPKVYAEKLLYLKEGQYSPMHFHWFKTEDIINRGGGNVLIRVYTSNPDETINYETDVTVHTDGRTYTVPAGAQVCLTPGESIHIQQFMYHDFEIEPGTGAVLLGEVSHSGISGFIRTQGSKVNEQFTQSHYIVHLSAPICSFAGGYSLHSRR